MPVGTKSSTYSSLPTDQVLLRAGVTNETYFYQKFRELHGMTLAEYRAGAIKTIGDSP